MNEWRAEKEKRETPQITRGTVAVAIISAEWARLRSGWPFLKLWKSRPFVAKVRNAPSDSPI